MKRKNRFWIYPLAIMGVCSLFTTNCKDTSEDPVATPTGKLAVLTTIAISDTTTTSATSGGNVTSEGGAEVTARGVCWGTVAAPTIAGNKTSDGAGIGSFSSSITGLTPNTIYYVRAYATNSLGTAYGNSISFKSPKTAIKAPETYTQKVIVESTTCAGSPYDPDLPVYMDKLYSKFGITKVYGVSMHNAYQGGDFMANDESKSFSDIFSGGNPTGMVNRSGGKCESRANWDAKATAFLGNVANCGLAIDASQKTGSVYKIKITAGIGKNDLPASNYYIIGYLVKRQMTGTGSGWDQANSYNGTTSHPYYQKGNPIKGYIHKNVFVKSLSTMTGTMIPVAKLKAGSLSESSFDLDMTGLIASDYDIIVMIYYKSITAPNVENVQKVEVGQNKAFD